MEPLEFYDSDGAKVRIKLVVDDPRLLLLSVKPTDQCGMAYITPTQATILRDYLTKWLEQQ